MIMNVSGALKIIPILLLPLFVIAGCAAPRVSQEEAPGPEVRTAEVGRTVSEFLQSLKDGDYGKAYGYVFMPDMDKTEYVRSIKEARDRDQSSIHGYTILDTLVFTGSAVVDAEIEMSYKPEGSGEILRIKRINRYELSEIKGWRITGEECIRGCGN